jgi:DNA-binding response OmpR family regulator
MRQQNILLLEDDLPLHQTIKQFLEHIGYRVLGAFDAFEAKDIIYEHSIDLMLLDIKVPYQNGFDLLSEIREGGDKTSAIFITSLNSVDDVTRGFDVGCDDYIRKPFALRELQARIDVLLRRNYDTYKNQIELKSGYLFNIDTSLLYHNNKRVSLRAKEIKLLTLFLKNPNRLLSYEEIFRLLWEYDETPSVGSLRAYINTIRHILGKKEIETVKHVGYRYVKE